MIKRLVKLTAAAGAFSLLLSGCGGPDNGGNVSEGTSDADVNQAFSQAAPNLDNQIQAKTKTSAELGVPQLDTATAQAPAPATRPVTPAASDKPLTEADKYLKDYLKNHGGQASERNDEADLDYNRALQLYNFQNYAGALRFVDSAVLLNPNHGPAQALRAKILVAIRGNTPEGALAEVHSLNANAQAERDFAIRRKIEEGENFRNDARKIAPDSEPDLAMKERMLGEKIDLLQKALNAYNDAKTLVDYADLTAGSYAEYRGQVRGAITSLRAELSDNEEQVAQLRRQVILEKQAEDQKNFERAHGEKMRILLDEVQRRIDDGRYESAEDMAERIRALEHYTGPYASEATSLRDHANSLKHSKNENDLINDKKFSIDTHILEVERRHIPYQKLIVYPEDWDHVVARQGKRESLTGKEGIPEWKRRIQEKLQKPIEFNFAGEQLRTVLDYLRDRAGVSFVYNPTALEGKPPVELDVSGMTIMQALKLVLQTSGGNLGYVIRDHAVYIDDQAKLTTAGGGMVLIPYEVGDITVAIRDYVGPDITLDSGSTLPPPPPAPTPPPPDITTIQTLITTTIEPDSWAAGGTADAFGDKLFINQRPEIHDQISRFLAEYRATQKVMVNVESRFMEVRDADFEEIGVEIQGINTLNQFYAGQPGLRGDFGDITGIYRGFVKTNRAGGSGLINPAASNSVPVPGLRTPPRKNGIGSNGFISLVGTSVTSFINYARQVDPGSPAISSLEGIQGDVIAGGFNGQLFYSNGVQLNAYIHAVHATENSATVFAPRLTIRNGQRAYVVVAKQEAYVRDYNTNGQLLDPVIDTIIEGVSLDVRPIVSYDRRYVTLDMNPTLSQIVRIRQIPISGIIIDQLGQIQGAISAVIEAPQLFMHKVRTSAMIPDGGVLYISGMYRDIKFDNENSIPIIGDIPVVGRLFRWTVAERAKQNIAMVLSPRIILLDEEERKFVTGTATEK
ncbi:MAG TPA: hypothetical protein VL860_07935 [Planctomycetota bacterium]|nr:hypothetical protein [Planctomycetota bacterium]